MSSSVMSVNINVLKDIHRNHKEETDVKLKTERNVTDARMYVPKRVL